MIWVNIDIPSKRFVVHAVESCIYVRKKAETSLKGVGELKLDGGWMPFLKRNVAIDIYNEKFGHFELVHHC